MSKTDQVQSFEEKWRDKNLLEVTPAERAEYQKDMTHDAIFVQDGLDRVEERKVMLSEHMRQVMYGSPASPEWAFAPQEPVPAQRMGYKAKKAAKAARGRQLRSRKEDMFREHHQHAQEDRYLAESLIMERRQYGKVANKLVMFDERVRTYSARNARLVQQHPELAEGSNETRDCAQFIGEGFQSDEHMADVKRNLIVLQNASAIRLISAPPASAFALVNR